MADSVKIDCNVDIPLRDGVKLRADIYRPDDTSSHPVLLARLPYNKDLSLISLSLLSPVRAARRGYVVVIQDTRGRFKSDGQFSLFAGEAEDGYDTVAWCAAQPWSNGQVGMYGASYFGATQWLTATANPPALKAIVPTITSSDYYEGWTYQGGAFQQGFIQFWAAGMATETLTRLSDAPADARSKLYGSIFGMHKAYWGLPLADFPPATVPGLIDHYREWLKHPALDDYWECVRIESKYEQIDVAALHIGGWYDIFLEGTLRNFVGMRTRGKSSRARQKQRLIVGPWLHGLIDRVVGEVDFGPSVLLDAVDLGGLHLQWFDHCLRDQPDNGAPVRIFVMGANIWRNENEWPLARAIPTRYYLTSDGSANSARGNGQLLSQPPVRTASDTFLYDPERPVPTRGGCTLMPGAQSAGPRDQRPVEERDDVLVYTAEPLTEPTEVTGTVEAIIYAATDGRDTDFTAKLVAVAPDGRALNLCDGIVRARYRNSLARAELLEPGRVYEYHIQLGSMSYLFAPGYCIRLEVSSSNFPRFDRNLNTGGDFATESVGRPAVQHVFHGGPRASYVVLPMVPRS
jgi:putative CocE/NonD family hydrolase